MQQRTKNLHKRRSRLLTKIERTHKPVVVDVCLGPVSKTKRVRDFELICEDSLKYTYNWGKTDVIANSLWSSRLKQHDITSWLRADPSDLFSLCADQAKPFEVCGRDVRDGVVSHASLLRLWWHKNRCLWLNQFVFLWSNYHIQIRTIKKKSDRP